MCLLKINKSTATHRPWPEQHKKPVKLLPLESNRFLHPVSVSSPKSEEKENKLKKLIVKTYVRPEMKLDMPGL